MVVAGGDDGVLLMVAIIKIEQLKLVLDFKHNNLPINLKNIF